MTKEQTTNLLKNQYDREKWKSFLLETIGNRYFKILLTPEEIELNDSLRGIAKQITRYATVETPDEEVLPVFEIILQDHKAIDKNRVMVNELVRNLMRKKGRTGAFATFAYSKDHQKTEWRFSFIAHEEDSYGLGDEDDENYLLKTTPKRYTYIFGTPEMHRTAVQRFEQLKDSDKTVADFMNAFAVEKLSKEFFNKYRSHYGKFIAYLIGKDENDKPTGKPAIYLTTIFKDNEKVARDFVKKTLGRIIFLYFLQRKGWLGVAVDGSYGEGNPNFLADLFKNAAENQSIFYSQYLDSLFFEYLNTQRPNDLAELIADEPLKIPYLNGGLFERDRYLKKQHSIDFPSELFADLFDFLGQYNFTINENSPQDHTVAVDPEMLGHIFENLLEDNKDKGAFYTPKAIVHYMCQESLIEYLTTHLSEDFTLYRTMGKQQIELFGNEGKVGQLSLVQALGSRALNREDVELIVKEKNVISLSQEQLKRIDQLLDDVKICDPAIGSGAFPMGLLQEIFGIKEVIANRLNKEWQPAKVKENIIQNSIYGVDIEEGAVDIARLRFWLSLIVDEDVEQGESPKPLPNLDYKIVVGNSLLPEFDGELIEIDWNVRKTTTGKMVAANIRKLLAELVEEQKAFFSTTEKHKKNQKNNIRDLKLRIVEKQIELNQKIFNHNNKDNQGDLFKKPIKRVKKNLKIQEFGQLLKRIQKLRKDEDEAFQYFDWKLDFPNIMNSDVANQISREGKFDIIIANPPYVDIKQLPKTLVKTLFSNYSTTQNRINLYSVFLELANELINPKGIICFINPNSLLLNSSYQKIRQRLANKVNTIIKLPDDIFENAIVETIIILCSKCDSNDLIKGAYYKNDSKIDFNNLNFRKFKRKSWIDDKENKFNIFVTQEIVDVLNKIKLESKPLIDYCDFCLGITPYDKYKGQSPELIKNKEYHSKTKDTKNHVPLISGKNITRYHIDSTISEYLNYGDWLGAPRQRKFFTSPRIIVRQIVSGNPPKIYAGYTEKELYHTQIGFVLLSKKDGINLKILLGILNSKLMNFYHTYTYLDIEKKTFQKVLIANAKQLPIKISKNESKFIEPLIDYILFLSENQIDNFQQTLQATYFEQIIDGIVYELYFPDLLKTHQRTIIEHLGELPLFTKGMNETDKTAIVEAVFARLDDKEHPVRNNLFYMNTIPEIAIIEGT